MPIKFENVFNWSNMLTLGSVLVVGLATFTTMKTELAYFRAEYLDERRESRQSQREMEIRVRALELGFGRIEERLINIQNLLQQQQREGEPE